MTHSGSSSPTRSASPAGASARCPRCGRAFDCGKRADPSEPFNCWCTSMPAVPSERLVPNMRCLCPECLAEAIVTVSPEAPSG
ncbi:cysteine-rich CWC family protein [Trinickia sp. YCB016]